MTLLAAGFFERIRAEGRQVPLRRRRRGRI